MSTKFLSPGWRMPRNANQSKQSNYSMYVDSTPYIKSSLSVDELNEITISLWFKTSLSNQSDGVLVSFPETTSATGVDISFQYSNPNEKIRFNTYTHSSNDRVEANFNYSDNNWHHLICSYNGSVHNIYIDGVLKASESASGTLKNAQNEFFIGAFNTTYPSLRADNTFFDQVCVFNYALSLSQITTLYGDSTNGPGNPMALPSSPIAYYPLGTSAWNGNFLAENNAIGDYVFNQNGLQLVTIPGNSTTQPTGDYSLSIWVKIVGSGTLYSGIFNATNNANNNGVGLLYNYSTGNFQFYQSAYANGLIFAGSTNTWQNIIISYNNTTGDLIAYRNGQPADSNTITPSAVNWLVDWQLNNYRQTASPLYGQNEFSNFQIFNTALSATDAETLYNYGSPIQTLASIPQSSNLKAWYKLDSSEIYNSSNTEWEISDATAAIKLSTLQNPPGTFTENAYRVSDSSGVINFPSNSTGTLKLSTSIWFYAPSSVSSGQDFQLLHAGPQSRLWLGFSGSNQLRAIISNGGWMIGNSVTMGQWNQFTATIDIVSNTRTVKFYINGQPAGAGTQSGGSPISASDGITVSAYGYGTYSGQVLSSNSVFWDNVILTDAEVLSHYNSFSVSNGVPTLQPALSSFPQSSSVSGWYKLDGNPKDSSGNSRDATYGSHNNVSIGPSVSNNNGQSSGMSQSNLVQSDLSFKTSYSPYALDFDGTDDYISCGNDSSLVPSSLTISLWFKTSGSASVIPRLINKSYGGSPYDSYFIRINNNVLNFKIGVSSASVQIAGTTNVVDGNWHNVIGTYDGSQLKLYLDGNSEATPISETRAIIENTSYNLTLGCELGAYGFSWPFTGSISNVSIWNTPLTSSQVREIYNDGVPSNLNNHSAYSDLVSWWQLGSNSSFNTNWTVLDEKGSNNGTSVNMTEADIVDGVGTTANGISNGMAVEALVGNAPYSDANAISSGMAVTAKGTDVP